MRRKKIISSLLILTMMISFLSIRMISASEEAPKLTISITPDKTEANPGDEITYTLAIGPVENLGGIDAVLDMPEGLTYVDGSCNIGDKDDNKENTKEQKAARNDLMDNLGADNLGFYKDGYNLLAMISGGYTNTSNTTLMTFKCSVNEDATAGDKAVGLSQAQFVTTYDGNNKNHPFDCEVTSTPVTVIRPCTHENVVKTDAVAPTCTEPGNNDYYTCSDCNKIFKAKADGSINTNAETTVAAETIAARGHALGAYQSDEDGHWRACTREGCDYTEGTSEEPIAHTWEEDAILQEATAEKLGKKGKKCTVCNYVQEGSEYYYMAADTIPSKLPDGSYITASDIPQARATADLDGEEIEVTLQDPLGILPKGFTLKVSNVRKGTSDEDLDEQELENGIFMDLKILGPDGTEISGYLDPVNQLPVRLAMEIPEDVWDDDIQTVRINEDKDTDFVETFEYRLYEGDRFIRLVDKDYEPKDGERVERYSVIWTNHFSKYATINPVDAIEEGSQYVVDEDGNIVDENGNVVGSAESASSSSNSSAVKTGETFTQAYFAVVSIGLATVAIYWSMKKIRKAQNR